MGAVVHSPAIKPDSGLFQFQILWKTVWSLLIKLNTYNPAVPLISIYPKEMK